MIISCSRRTDIPAAHADWLMRRLAAGYCLVPNPRNARQVSRVSLRPEDVDVLVFWTKNPEPLLPHLPALDARGYRYYFLYTLNGYDRWVEPGIPDPAARIRTFRQLADLIGPEKVVWRYDPILISGKTDFGWHRETFCRIAQDLRGFTQRTIVSLVDFYRKTERGMRELDRAGYRIVRDPAQPELLESLIPPLVTIARQAGLEIQSCAETIDLQPYGIAPGKCIDDGLVRRVFGIAVDGGKDSHQRACCQCVSSKDIGQYNTCPLGCRYCYASAQPGGNLLSIRTLPD